MRISKKKNALRRTKRFPEGRINRFAELVLKHFDITEIILPTDKFYPRGFEALFCRKRN